MRKHSKKIAFCGMFAALSIVLMLLGALVPVFLYCSPALCGLLVLIAAADFGMNTAFVLYAAVSLLSLMLVPDTECALLYACFFGYYPLVKAKVQRLRPKLLVIVSKVLIFNISMLAVYAAVLLLLSPGLLQQAGREEYVYAALLLFVGNIGFWAYDLLLQRILVFYIYRLRPKLKHLF